MTPISLGMAKRRSADRGHPFPAPRWWMAAISKVRESMTDAALIEALEAQTGRAYSKFTISRYFSDDAPTTTLELTMDLWATFGQRHGIPRPFIIAETRAEAEKLSPLGGDVERAGIMRDLRKLDAELKARVRQSVTPR